MNLFTPIIDFVIPRLCAECSIKLDPADEYICEGCRSKISILNREDFAAARDEICRGSIDDVFSLFLYQPDSPVRALIHKMKYDQTPGVGRMLGKEIGEMLRDYGYKFDLIIPVPLHPLRKAERGFNQAVEITKGITSSLPECEYLRLLRRIKYTSVQANLNIEERRSNVSGAFRVVKNHDVKGKNIALVDDVITTGATINECASVIKNTGKCKITAVSAALA